MSLLSEPERFALALILIIVLMAAFQFLGPRQ
jgi:hypothetical protein